MVRGLIGKKLGMVQIFDDSGHAMGVTVVEAGPCTVTGKTAGARVQLGFGPAKEKSLNKPLLGQFKKVGVEPFRVLREFDAVDVAGIEIGRQFKADIFDTGELVKVVGTSKGKGFAGVMKRHNFGGGRETHGSRSHRIPGSVGQCAYPSRVFKGKKLPGRLGGKRTTAPSVRVVQVRADQNLLFLKGPIPGANGGIVIIRKS
jgi:large subunit ribosomal protein L3